MLATARFSHDARTDRIARTILETEVARRLELVRISETAIGLHEARISGHRDVIAGEEAEIARLRRALRKGPPE